MKKLSILLALPILLSLACKKNETDQSKIDMEKIEKYLQDNSLNAEAHPSGIYYIIDIEGTGDHPNSNSIVEVSYKGTLLDNGIVFDQTSPGETTVFSLTSLIEGWQIAVPLLKRGGKGTFFIPSELGYGPSFQGGIPPNSVLIFEIALVDF